MAIVLGYLQVWEFQDHFAKKRMICAFLQREEWQKEEWQLGE
jgi:hypothetical protein